MRDHGEAAQAEQVGAAVGVRVEPVAKPPGRRPDQQAAELAGRRGGDLLAQRVEQLRIVPSSSFSATLPVKPSVTTTSAAPREQVAALARCRRS